MHYMALYKIFFQQTFSVMTFLGILKRRGGLHTHFEEWFSALKNVIEQGTNSHLFTHFKLGLFNVQGLNVHLAETDSALQ